MSEIKPEVEYVIKIGRQVVEKKQVDFPDKLGAQLDAVKQQYNDLGANVSVFMTVWFSKFHNFKVLFSFFFFCTFKKHGHAIDTFQELFLICFC